MLPSSLTPFFEPIPEKQYGYYSNVHSCRELNLDFLDSLKKLMNKYKIDVPIVSIISGNEYQNNLEYRKVLSKARVICKMSFLCYKLVCINDTYHMVIKII